MDSNNEFVRAEYEKLAEMVKRAPEEKQAALLGVAEQLALLKSKLDEERPKFEKAKLVDKWNNGGGQSGTRESVFIRSYCNMLKLYMDGVDKLQKAVPAVEAEKPEEVSRNVTPLELILNKRKVVSE